MTTTTTAMIVRKSEDEAFREVMDLIRDAVTPEVKDRVIELWATAIHSEFWRGWDRGYDVALGKG